MTEFECLPSRLPEFPHYLLTLDEVTSTNAIAKQRCAEFSEKALWTISARKQTAGYGRKGASWISDSPKNLYATFCLKKKIPFSPGLWSLWVGHCFCQTLKSAVKSNGSTSRELFVKWPNDICQIQGGELTKVGGILTEVMQGCILCGVGLNLGHAPPTVQADPAPGVLKAGHMGLSVSVVPDIYAAFYDLAATLEFDPMSSIVSQLKDVTLSLVNGMREHELQWFWVSGLSKAGAEPRSLSIEDILSNTGGLKVRFGDGKVQELLHGSLYAEKIT